MATLTWGGAAVTGVVSFASGERAGQPATTAHPLLGGGEGFTVGPRSGSRRELEAVIDDEADAAALYDALRAGAVVSITDSSGLLPAAIIAVDADVQLRRLLSVWRVIATVAEVSP